MQNANATTPTADNAAIQALPEELQGVASSVFDSFLSIWENFVGHLPYVLGAIVVVFATWVAAKISLAIAGRAMSRASMRQSLKDLLLRFISLGVWSLGVLFAAMILFPGLTPAKALGALGLVSIAVGLAFKDIFENFFAGILLLWRFPFENGDFIECEGLVGQVEEILIRMTKIRKTTGELVVVPNSFLFKNPVDVLTDRGSRRTTLPVGIAYGEDVNKAVDVITQAVADCESVNQDKPVQIWPTAFGSSSIDIDVTWWTDARPVDIRRSRGELVTAIKMALDEAGIEIPFPYRTLTFKEPLVTKTEAG